MPIFVGSAQVQKMYIGSAEISAAANSGSNVLGPAGSFPGITNSSLYLPLKTSIVPSRGSNTPTFTRATVAWSFDNEGKLNLNIPSGCVRFKGGRFVMNKVPKSSDFSSAEWSTSNLTKVSTVIADPLGGTAGCELSSAGALLDHYITGGSVTSVSYTSGTDNCFSCYAKAGSITKVQLTHTTTAFGSSQYANFDLVSGTVITSTG